MSKSFRFDTFQKEGCHFGRIAEDVEWRTGILGYTVTIAQKLESKKGVMLWVHCDLFPDGRLRAYNSTEYDFGSGPAINNLPVIYSSLKHDMGCHLTGLGLIAWKFRAWFDKWYREGLIERGCHAIRAWWHWAAVRANSKFVAYWKAEK